MCISTPPSLPPSLPFHTSACHTHTHTHTFPPPSNPISHTPPPSLPSSLPLPYSGEQVELRQKSTARKRRRNQNDEIDELASLLPVKPASVSVSAKQPAIDKISVLRLSSSYLKFQQFLDLCKSANENRLITLFYTKGNQGGYKGHS